MLYSKIHFTVSYSIFMFKMVCYLLPSKAIYDTDQIHLDICMYLKLEKTQYSYVFDIPLISQSQSNGAVSLVLQNM